MPPPGPEPRSAADRLLDVPAAFDQDELTLSLTAISQPVGLQPITAYRLAGALTRWNSSSSQPPLDELLQLRSRALDSDFESFKLPYSTHPCAAPGCTTLSAEDSFTVPGFRTLVVT